MVCFLVALVSSPVQLHWLRTPLERVIMGSSGASRKYTCKVGLGMPHRSFTQYSYVELTMSKLSGAMKGRRPNL